jgi:hypothetical protein
MKKFIIGLTVLLIFLLTFNVVGFSTIIDIGAAATNRTSEKFTGTYIVTINPADGTGKITNVEIYAVTGYNLTLVEVATFYVVSGNFLSTRDWEYIGNVTAGSKQTFIVDLDVTVGDYIGIYFASGGKIEADSTGTYMSKAGDNIPCTNIEFTSPVAGTISLYGTGETVAVGIKWNTQTISKWDEQVITKWNGLE